MKLKSKNLRNKGNPSQDFFNHLSPKLKIFFLIPLIIVIAIIPLIVTMKEYKTGLSNYSWFLTEDSYFDFFLYYKHLIFVVISFFMAIIILIRSYIERKKMRFTVTLLPLCGYAILALLSTVFSKYSSFGYNGIYEQFESIFALLGYCIVVYYAYLFIDSEQDIKLILVSLLASSFLLGLLGLSQYLGHDIIRLKEVFKFFLPEQYRAHADMFTFTFDIKRVYCTLYNPNYVGVYVALVVPIFLSLLLTSKKVIYIIPYVTCTILLLISLYGSVSLSGFIGITASIILIIIFFRRYILKRYWLFIPLVTLGIIFLIIKGNVSLTKLSQFNDLFNMKKSESLLTDVIVNDEILIKYNNQELHIGYNPLDDGTIGFYFTDQNDNGIDYNYDNATTVYTLTDTQYAGITITPVSYDNLICAQVLINGKYWLFTNQLEENKYTYLNRYGRADEIINADSAIFTENESFASGRGYIWSRTIPLLKNKFILGSGADTFSLIFPQNDYVGLYNNNYNDSIMTKPHNLYLQIGVQTGVLSLILFLTFYLMYFIYSVRLYINGKFDDLYSQVGVAILIGTTCYMICGLTNDSSITVSPVFWALTGVGLAVNSKVSINKVKA